jgi:hypothetical protein
VDSTAQVNCCLITKPNGFDVTTAGHRRQGGVLHSLEQRFQAERFVAASFRPKAGSAAFYFD